MKKIYFVLVFAILFGFVGLNKASGQQDPSCPYLDTNLACYAPWQRIDVDIPYQCQGKTKISRVTLCYYCYISADESCYLIQEMRDVPPECEDVVKEAIFDWVVHNNHKHCGVKPCQNGTYKIRLKFPICADMDYTGNPGHYNITLNPDCNKICTWEMERCWCNCIPDDCWDEQCEHDLAGHIKWAIVNHYDTGFGTCQPQEVRRGELQGTQSKKIRVCQRFITICNKDEEPFPWVP